MANSTGGTIIIGIAEGNSRGIADRLDGGINPGLSCESIEQLINGNISPNISGIKISSIENPEIAESNYYVIEVPKSDDAPHMVNKEYRYYKRYNMQAKPMEHWEIEDVRQRKKAPKLTCELSILKNSLNTEEKADPSNSTSVKVIVKIDMLNNAVAHHVIAFLFIDKRINTVIPNTNWKSTPTTPRILINGQEIYFTSFFQTTNSYVGNLPIWQGADLTLGYVTLNIPQEIKSYFLGWELRTPGAAVQKGVQEYFV